MRLALTASHRRAGDGDLRRFGDLRGSRVTEPKPLGGPSALAPGEPAGSPAARGRSDGADVNRI